MTHEGHDGETLAEAKARFWYGLRHPFTRNPLARNRVGWKDHLWGHAMTNLYVTYTRENPRDAGHYWRYAVLALVAVSVIAVIGWMA